MKVLVSSDETGAVKEVVCVRGTDTSKKDGVKPESVRKVCLAPATSSKTKVKHMVIFEKYLVTARIDGHICIYDTTSDYELVKDYQLGHRNPVSLINYFRADVLVAAFEDGAVFFFSLAQEPVQVQLPTKKPIAAFVDSPDVEGVFAFGGEENDIKIVKVSTFSKAAEPETVFEAENVENDFLDMRVPVSITGIRFLQSEEDGYRFITVTKYGQLRIYDTKESKSPISDFKLCQKAIIQMTLAGGDESVVLADKSNLVAKYSLTVVDKQAVKINSASAGELRRSAAKLLGKFAEGGNTGAVHALYNYDDSLLATGGLDRYLRVFDIETRKLVAKVYVGTQVSCAIVVDDEQAEPVEEPIVRKKRTIRPADDEDPDELWNQLEKKPRSS